MILEKNNFQTAQEWTTSYIELIASYVHPKIANHLRSHLLRAMMALDHRTLIGPGKKFRPNFLRSTSLLYKILPTNLGACKPTFYIICDPPQEFDAKGESTRTTRLHDTLSVPQITDMRILNWKNKDGHTCLCFGKFSTLDLLFFCSVPYVTVSVRIIARLACN